MKILDNLSIQLNNIIDELFIGRRETTLEYIDLAIVRLMDFRESSRATLKIARKFLVLFSDGFLPCSFYRIGIEVSEVVPCTEGHSTVLVIFVLRIA